MQQLAPASAKPRASYKRLTIHARLIQLVLATAVPLTAFAAMLVLWHTSIEQDSQRQDASRTAAVAMQAIDREITGTISGLKVLAASPSLEQQDFATFHAQARSAVGIAGNSVIILYDAAGNKIMSTAVNYGQALSKQSNVPAITTAVASGKPYVSPLFTSTTVNQPMVGVIVPVIIAGHVRYLLGAGLLSSRLSDLMANSGLPQHWVAAVLDQEGTIIGRTRNAAEFIGTKARPEVWAHMQAVPSPTGIIEARTKEGGEASLAFTRSTTSRWTTAVAIPAELLHGQLVRSLWLLAATSAAVLLIAGVLAWRALKLITRPVAQLQSAASALEQGRQVALAATGVEQFDQLAQAMQHASHAIHQREKRLADSVKQLREAHRELSEEHAKKDEFIATLAHELRNPLAPVRTGIEVLSRHPAPEVAARTLSIMGRQLAHMVRLIDDLLDVSRIARGKLVLRKQLVDLREVVEDALASTADLVRSSGQHLIVENPQHPVLADADPARIAQVVTNLVENAVKYGRSGGTIKVAISGNPEAVEIRVSDTGAGIEAADIERIFELFYQVCDSTHPTPTGLGIGLSLSRRLVELHAGTLTATSPGAGQGSTFTVKLPVPGTETLRVDAPAATSSRAPASRRVLVVDDNEDAAHALAGLMRMVGHSVEVAHDGPSALQLAARSDYDVILLDIGMPHMNGHEACRRLRQLPRCQMTKIVALTGWGAESDREQSRQAGFNAHLTKPADWRDIEQVL